MVLAALAGFAVCAASVTQQYRLYKQAEYHDQPLKGRRLRVYQVGAGLAGAIVWAAAIYADVDAVGTACPILFATILVLLASTDFERRLLPNRLMYPAIVLGALLSWAWPDHGLAASWLGAGAAFAAAVAIFALGLAFGILLGVRATPFGIGDAKLIVLIGLIVGWPGMLTALFFGVIAAGVPAVVLMVRGRGKSVFSYGPYLAAGALVVMLTHG